MGSSSKSVALNCNRGSIQLCRWVWWQLGGFSDRDFGGNGGGHGGSGGGGHGVGGGGGSLVWSSSQMWIAQDCPQQVPSTELLGSP